MLLIASSSAGTLLCAATDDELAGSKKPQGASKKSSTSATIRFDLGTADRLLAAEIRKIRKRGQKGVDENLWKAAWDEILDDLKYYHVHVDDVVVLDAKTGMYRFASNDKPFSNIRLVTPNFDEIEKAKKRGKKRAPTRTATVTVKIGISNLAKDSDGRKKEGTLHLRWVSMKNRMIPSSNNPTGTGGDCAYGFSVATDLNVTDGTILSK
jgi:hypothetical protein